MRPPICAICGGDAHEDDGGLVYFARDADAEDWHRRAQQEGFVGHPPDAEWFCGEHRGEAERLADRTRSEAMAELRGR